MIRVERVVLNALVNAALPPDFRRAARKEIIGLRRSTSSSEKPIHLLASLFFLARTSKLFVPLFSSHAVLPISSRGRPVVRTNIRFTDRTANARLAGHSIRPACVDFRADWHRAKRWRRFSLLSMHCFDKARKIICLMRRKSFTSRRSRR